MPLRLRPEKDDPSRSFQVYAGEVRIGTIYFAVNVAKPNPPWFWALNGIMTGPPGMKFNGWAVSLDAAKATLKATWETWQKAIGLTDSTPL